MVFVAMMDIEVKSLGYNKHGRMNYIVFYKTSISIIIDNVGAHIQFYHAFIIYTNIYKYRCIHKCIHPHIPVSRSSYIHKI